MPQFSTDRWTEIAKGFKTYAHFPNCTGAFDGKHIRTKQPSTVAQCITIIKTTFLQYYLQCVMQIKCFTYIEVGSYGRASDSGIFNNSKLLCNRR